MLMCREVVRWRLLSGGWQHWHEHETGESAFGLSIPRFQCPGGIAGMLLEQSSVSQPSACTRPAMEFRETTSGEIATASRRGPCRGHRQWEQEIRVSVEGESELSVLAGCTSAESAKTGSTGAVTLATELCELRGAPEQQPGLQVRLWRVACTSLRPNKLLEHKFFVEYRYSTACRPGQGRIMREESQCLRPAPPSMRRNPIHAPHKRNPKSR